jgi:hypothetical protein
MKPGARRCRNVERPAALETHGFPRTVPIKWVRPRVSSGSLETGSGEGQSCGRPRACERKLLVGEQARRQSHEGAAGACNHDGTWVLEGHSWKVGIDEVLSLVWLQLDVKLASLFPRHAMRNASMEKGFLFFIM